MECIANYKKGKPLSDKHKQALKLASKGKVPTHLHNKENYKKIGDALRGVPLPRIQNEKHGEWKGINASYFAKHAWLARKYGKANKCEYIHCKYPRKTSNNKILLAPKIYNWALIHGKEHDHKRENYMMLCCSCHSRYDHNTIEI